MIAGLAQAPSRWSPVTNPELALRRRDEVLFDIPMGRIDAADADPEHLGMLMAGRGQSEGQTAGGVGA